ncbi:nucleoside hydrolase [Nocardioides gansuensis]|uniref:nucleoside hydrolase n=1 Tax=Nocardioides gansuensis TaxID=2138300 RepID=UPI0014032ED1|nr:nucleoside hydrolase [Nocardioides gansuensis]
MSSLGVSLAVAGCAVPYDDDGELLAGGRLASAPVKTHSAVPVVIDSDLAPDDLAAISYLVRHPEVRVVGVTVPTTGMVTCPAGIALLDDLFTAIEAKPVPVACGEEPRGAAGVPFPAWWGIGSLTDSGLERGVGDGSTRVSRRPAGRFLADAARRHPGLHVVALGPLTEVAALLRSDPDAYVRLAGVTTMAGIVEEPAQDSDLGVGEWNAAADPEAFASVVAGPVPVTVVPHDPVPPGRPAGMAVPVVGHLGFATDFESPAFWDLATAALFTLPVAARAETGTWRVDVRDDRGRLTRTGDGTVRVVTALDAARLDDAYRAVFEARD